MTYWFVVVAWINSIPAVIWSGAIGAAIAAGVSYFGVRSANKSSLDRLHAQHEHDVAEAAKQREHDAKQKDEDRKAAIRREVYTKAAEETHALYGAIGGFPDRPLAARATDTEPLQAFLRALAKVWLVAEADSAHLSREFVSDMSELFLNAHAGAFPIRIVLGPLPDLDKKIEHAEKEFSRITTWMNELHESDASEQTKTLANESWTRNNRFLDVLRAEKDRLIQSVKDQRFKHFKEVFEVMSPVQMKMVRLISLLRKELHLPADEEAFLAQHAEAQRRAWAMVCRAYGVKGDGVTKL